jgi:hypothetical protein
VVREARSALSAAQLAVTFESALSPFSREHVALAVRA